jgi:hypothetical protein
MFLGIVVTWSGVLLWAIKWILDRNQKHFDQRFDSTAERLRALEADVAGIRRELASEYVKREDWIRYGATITVKLENLWSRIDSLVARLDARGGGRDGNS